MRDIHTLSRIFDRSGIHNTKPSGEGRKGDGDAINARWFPQSSDIVMYVLRSSLLSAFLALVILYLSTEYKAVQVTIEPRSRARFRLISFLAIYQYPDCRRERPAVELLLIFSFSDRVWFRVHSTEEILALISSVYN